MNGWMWVAAVVFVAMGGLLHVMPRLSRPTIFFAVTVAPEFPATAEARRILTGYRAMVWGTMLAAAVLASGFQLVLPGILLTGVGMFGALIVGHRRALAFAAAPSAVVEVELSQPVESMPGGPVAVALPGLFLAGMTVWTATHLDRLPARLAVHGGLGGPDRWVDGTPRAVFALLASLSVMYLIAIGIAWALMHWSRRIETAGAGAAAERLFRRRIAAMLVVSSYFVVAPAWFALFPSGGWVEMAWGGGLLAVIVFFLTVLLRGPAPALAAA